MTAPRSRKQLKIYGRHLKERRTNKSNCEFCSITPESPQFVSETKFLKVVRNIFPYSVWDDQSVSDHLMLLPKLHIDSIAEFPPGATEEFMETISRYESEGYSIWARAPKSVNKSQIHQHTHLIKLNSRIIRALIHVKKPYFRLLIK